MNWRRGRNNSPPGTGGVAHSAGVVAGSNNSPSHSFIGIKENYFDFTTSPALRATPPVPGGELFLLLLQFIHIFCDRAYSRAQKGPVNEHSLALQFYWKSGILTVQ